MFLRTHHRRKYGKDHYYFSVVENRRVAGEGGSAGGGGGAGKTVQREVLYLGEINTTQEAAWRKTLAVFDEQRQAPTTLSLFADSQAVPADALDCVRVKLDQMRLYRPRAYGNCWLGCWLWGQLGLEVFWRNRLKLWAEENELLVLAKSQGRADKEIAIRRKKLKRLFKGLIALRRSCPERDRLLQRIGVLKHEAGRASGMVEIHVPKAGEEVTRETFHYQLRAEKFKRAEALDGHYLLRTSLKSQSPEVLWGYYMQLVEIEAAFKTLKSDLAIRPIHHQIETRVEAHLFVAFLAYCLTATLARRLKAYAPGLTPRAVLDKLAGIQMIDVKLPTTDGRLLVMPRHTHPEPDQQMRLDHLHLELPAQPPPRIYATQLPATQAKP